MDSRPSPSSLTVVGLHDEPVVRREGRQRTASTADTKGDAFALLSPFSLGAFSLGATDFDVFLQALCAHERPPVDVLQVKVAVTKLLYDTVGIEPTQRQSCDTAVVVIWRGAEIDRQEQLTVNIVDGDGNVPGAAADAGHVEKPLQ